MPKSRYGWPYAHPPNVDFDINLSSPQAQGLVFWLPLLGPRHGTYTDRVGGVTLTQNGSPAWSHDGWLGDSMLFDDAASDLLYITSPIVSSFPLSMTIWFNTDDGGNSADLIGIVDDWAVDWVQLGYNSVNDRPAIYVNGDTASLSQQSLGTSTPGTWNHAAYVGKASNDHAVFLNGRYKDTNSTDVGSIAGIDHTGIGGRADNSPAEFFSGMLFDARIYDRPLADNEVRSMFEPETRWDLYRPRVRLWAVNFEAAGEALSIAVTPDNMDYYVEKPIIVG